MLDLNFVRDNLELVKLKMGERGFGDGIKDFESLDATRRTALVEAEQRKARRNKVSDEIAHLMKQKQDASARIAEMKILKEEIESLDKKAESLGKRDARITRRPAQRAASERAHRAARPGQPGNPALGHSAGI